MTERRYPLRLRGRGWRPIRQAHREPSGRRSLLNAAVTLVIVWLAAIYAGTRWP